MPPFTFLIRSRIPIVAEGIHALYTDCEVGESEGGFSDFHVQVAAKRRWYKPQCVFELDGERPFTPLALGEAFAFLEWGMNWCVTGHCHHYLILHAAVLERGGRAVILPAPPGSGKSTLCAALSYSGWRLLSDELAILDPMSGHLVPFPRPIGLKNRSIDVMRERLGPAGVFGPIAHDTLKGTVAHLRAPNAALASAHESAVPAWVILPRYQAGHATTLTLRTIPLTLMALAENCFNFAAHGRKGFEVLANIADRVGAYDFTYSNLDEAVAVFNELAER